MSTERRSPVPKSFDRVRLLTVLAEARRELVAAQRAMRPKSGLSRSADAVISEIDEFAFVVTGDRETFHANAHGTPPAVPGKRE